MIMMAILRSLAALSVAAGLASVAALFLAGTVAAADPILDTSEAVAPVSEPVSDASDTLSTASEPVVESTEPIVGPVVDQVEETADPLIEEAAPIVDPILEPIEPIVDPILDPVEPIVDPILDPVEPIVDPILEPIEPIVDPIVDPAPMAGERPPILATDPTAAATPSEPIIASVLTRSLADRGGATPVVQSTAPRPLNPPSLPLPLGLPITSSLSSGRGLLDPTTGLATVVLVLFFALGRWVLSAAPGLKPPRLALASLSPPG